MQENFWLEKWRQNQIGFHQSEPTPELTKFISTLTENNPKKNILVPLCGKTKDMLFLSSKGLKVSGFEFSHTACTDFFKDNQLEFTSSEEAGFKILSDKKHTLYCGDYFSFEGKNLFSAAFDRAALVAISPDKRTDYAQMYSRLLAPKASLLLMTFEYESNILVGPPFSIEEELVYELFEESFKIELLSAESVKVKSPKLFENGVTSASQKTFHLIKK